MKTMPIHAQPVSEQRESSGGARGIVLGLLLAIPLWIAIFAVGYMLLS